MNSLELKSSLIRGQPTALPIRSALTVDSVKYSEDSGLLRRDEKGALREPLSQRRVIIFSCSAYRSMCDSLYEQFQSGASIILYKMGEGYGKKLVKGAALLQLSQGELIEAFEKLAHMAGWGRLSIKVNDPNSIDAVVEESPFLLRRDDAGPCSCHFLAGVLGGGASEILGSDYKAQELRCAAPGEGVCRFKIVPQRKIA